MLPDLKKQLNKVGPELLQEIDPDNGLFPYLLSFDVLTDDQVDTCKAKCGRLKKVEEILTLLKCQPDICYFNFCKALEKIGRLDLVNNFLTPSKFQSLIRPAGDTDVGLSTTAIDLTLTGVLNSNFRTVARSMTVTQALLADLTSAEYLKDRIPEVESEQTPHEKVNKLLSILRYLPQQSVAEVFTTFLSALRQDGQEHVANMFCKESDAMPMSVEHHMLLCGKDSELCKFIEPFNGLLNELVFSKAFSYVDKKRVMHSSSRGCDAASHDIIDILSRKSDDAFDKFIAALHKTSQGHVARILGDQTGSHPMSDEHRRTLSNKKSEMVNCIDPEYGLLDDLVSCGCFVDFDAERVRQAKGLDAMSREIIEILIRKPDDAFTNFINALNNTNQGHVVSILVEPSTSLPMSREHRRLLVNKKCKIVELMDPECGLLHRLLSEDVFNSLDESRINGEGKLRQNKAAKVVDLLLRKSDLAFDSFISALKDTGHEHVAYILTGEGDYPPLSEMRLKILRKMRDRMIRKIDSEASSIVSQLFMYGVINSIERDNIDNQEKVVKKNEMILNAIERKSDASYVKFLQALIDTGQGHVAQELDGNFNINGTLVDNFRINTPEGEIKQTTRFVIEGMLPLLEGQGGCGNINELMSLIQQNGFIITKITEGSIRIAFGCYTEESLANLRRLYTDKTLDRLFTEAFCPQFAEEGLESLTLCIEDEEFERCSQALEQLAVPTDELSDSANVQLCKTRVYSRQTSICSETHEDNVSIFGAQEDLNCNGSLHKPGEWQVARIHSDQPGIHSMSGERIIATNKAQHERFTGNECSFWFRHMSRGSFIGFDDERMRTIKGSKSKLFETSDIPLLNRNVLINLDMSNRTNQDNTVSVLGVQSPSNTMSVEIHSRLDGFDGFLAVKNFNNVDESEISQYEKVLQHLSVDAVDTILRKSDLTFNNSFAIPILTLLQLLSNDGRDADKELTTRVDNNEIIFSESEQKFHSPYATSNLKSIDGTNNECGHQTFNVALQHLRNKLLWTFLQDNKTLSNVRHR